MAANPKRRFSNAGMDASRMYPPELLPLLQSLLATVADIDFDHESDVETVRNSSADEWLKQTTIRKLQECHQERRMPYVQQLESLQRRLRALAA
jgi:hypothetical protein